MKGIAAQPRVLVSACVALAGALNLTAWADQTAALSGAVRSVQGAPIERARVVLSGGTPLVERSVLTAADGTFLFSGVPAGQYQLSAEKAGYLRNAFGASAPLSSGTPVVVAGGTDLSTLEVRLTRSSAVAGIIRDGAGNPLPGVRVSALRWGYGTTQFDRGVRRLKPLPGSPILSDSKGRYRLFSLPPGEYVIAVPGRQMVSEVESQSVTTADDVRRAELILAGRTDPGPTRIRPEAVFPQTFYPGTPTLSQARTVRVAPGDERDGVDFVVKPESTVTLAGTIAEFKNINPARLPNLWLRAPVQAPGERMSFARVQKDGTFDVPGLFAGNYVIHGRANFADATVGRVTHWARSEVSLGGSGVTDVVIGWRPVVTLTGRVQFEGEAGGPMRSATGVAVSLFEYGETSLSDVPGGKTGSDMTFTVGGVTPSRYRIGVTAPAGWTLKSIAGVENTDLADAVFTIRDDVPTPSLVITFSTNMASLSGNLQTAVGRPATSYTVIAFDRDRQYWTSHTRRVVAARPATDGSFSFSGLPAGEYLLAAVTDLEEGQAFNPEFLASLVPSALPVTLADGAKVTQNLRIAK